MEVLGVGPLELFFILIIALIFLGPRDMVKAGRTMGKYLRKIVMSPTWRMVQQTSRELRTLPNRMIREAGMEEDIKDLDQLRKDVENQIGSISKPFSATANELNKNLRAAESDLATKSKPSAPVETVGQGTPSAPVEAAPQTEPAHSTNLSAWTTPPTDPELVEDSTAPSESHPSDAPDHEPQAAAEPPTSIKS